MAIYHELERIVSREVLSDEAIKLLKFRLDKSPLGTFTYDYTKGDFVSEGEKTFRDMGINFERGIASRLRYGPLFAMIKVLELAKSSEIGIISFKEYASSGDKFADMPIIYDEDLVIHENEKYGKMYAIVKTIADTDQSVPSVVDYYDSLTMNMDAYFVVCFTEENVPFIRICFLDNEKEDIIIRNGDITVERVY